jgi:60 kDa SS-A/Ro ribonucleoprotein
MSKYGNLFTSTIQTSPIPGEEKKMSWNNAGGFSFTLDKWKRLDRFLILGSDTNTYYAKARDITKENASVVTECWGEDALKTAKVIREISLSGRAPKNSPAIFALALGSIHGNPLVRKSAFSCVSSVCRTASHLFEFVETSSQLGKGWGRGMKKAIQHWYDSKNVEHLAYQMVKYRQRNNYTHRDLLRLAHPKSKDVIRNNLYAWACGKENVSWEHLPNIVQEHHIWMQTEEKDFGTHLPEPGLHGLPWEALPTWANKKPIVWSSLLPNMPLHALIRNLGNMTRLGVFEGTDKYDALEGGYSLANLRFRLTNPEQIKRSRLHPFTLLNALKTYTEGKGFRGSNHWEPRMEIVSLLGTAFNLSWENVEGCGKRLCFALDISPSMDGSMLFNSALSARDASSAMVMASLMAEEDENCAVVAFSSGRIHNYYGGGESSLVNVKPKVNSQRSLQDVIKYTQGLPYSGTDCSLPIKEAFNRGVAFDAFIIYTDSETFAGNVHAAEILREYRSKMNIPDAKLIVVGMTSNGFSIADPNDPNMLDVVGFDSSAPSVIASFLRGRDKLEQGDISETSEDIEEDNLG